jgi:hypothetical protein
VSKLSPPPATEPVVPEPLRPLRREAILGASAEVAAHDRDEAVIAVRTYGAGYLALAIGGDVESATIGRLRGLLYDPAFLALTSAELVVDLSNLRSCAPGLLRLLHQLRAQRRAEGRQVELYEPNHVLASELEDANLAEAFTVYDAVHRAHTTRQP